MSDNISLKLPPPVITVLLPQLQTTGATTALSGSTRITEQNNTRVTRGGHTRVTRDYTIISYPELVVLKLSNGVVNVPVEEEQRTRGRYG
jgi:hypothetical protein